MFGLFGKKEGSQSAEPAPAQAETYTAPGTQIHYSAELINGLKSDHQSLLTLYGKIDSEFKEGRYEEVSSLLNDFKSELNSHLLTENVRLYIYLERSLAHDPTTGELIHGFRKEMDEIAKVALGFLKKYETIGVDAQLASHFGPDFKTIGEVLVERIQKEEHTLYPLYQPSY